MILVRPAVLADQAVVRALKNDPDALFWAARAVPVTATEHAAWFPRALFDSDVTLLVADDDAAGTVGYARIRTHHESRISVAVAPRRRNQGIGANLLAACEEVARARRLPALMAYIHPGNAASLAVFRQQGYTLGEMRGLFQTVTKALRA